MRIKDMLLRIKKGWELKENQTTDESIYKNRRQFMGQTGKLIGLGAAASVLSSISPAFAAGRYPATRNQTYQVERALTEEAQATSYVNYYEFGSHKDVSKPAQSMNISPWTVTIDGLVNNPMQIDFEDLMTRVSLQERIYRHRCVEAWAMTVPWSGFPLSEIVKLADPKSEAKYVTFETLEDKKTMPGLSAIWYPWPYREGVTIEEAKNDMAFMATGLYGKDIPKQNGAPLRLVLPWKYGFKSIKSIVRISFTKERPVSFWEKIADTEYGFWANVNPEIPHSRWSQSSERLLGVSGKVPTRLYNGYGEFVADLYKNMKNENLFM
jgi:sulfoxide reductase catalytic subunit YedY